MVKQKCTDDSSAIGWQSPVCRLHSPCSALQGAEQSRFSLDIWHSTRASPLPIRPPTHLHPSPIQTLLAINKQLKCQPVPGKSPRQLHPIQQVQEQLPCTVLEQVSINHEPGYTPGIPPATLWSSCQWMACRLEHCYLTVSPGCSQHHTNIKSLSVHTKHYIGMIQSCINQPSPNLTFPLWAFLGKLLLDTDTQLGFAQIPKLDGA